MAGTSPSKTGRGRYCGELRGYRDPTITSGQSPSPRAAVGRVGAQRRGGWLLNAHHHRRLEVSQFVRRRGYPPPVRPYGRPPSPQGGGMTTRCAVQRQIAWVRLVTMPKLSERPDAVAHPSMPEVLPSRAKRSGRKSAKLAARQSTTILTRSRTFTSPRGSMPFSTRNRSAGRSTPAMRCDSDSTVSPGCTVMTLRRSGRAA